MAGMCGASVPAAIDKLFDGLENDPKTRELVTAHVAAELVGALSDGGVDQFHLYTLNRADLALSTCALLGVKPHAEQAVA
jgi:methylenetetrahydrofolate reductase (NADPH)